jgi:hypothetical protein
LVGYEILTAKFPSTAGMLSPRLCLAIDGPPERNVTRTPCQQCEFHSNSLKWIGWEGNPFWRPSMIFATYNQDEYIPIWQ